MSKTTIFLGILVGLPLSAQADPRAMMMMQGAWMQNHRQPRQVATPGPLQLATSRPKAPRMAIPAIKLKTKTTKPSAVKQAQPKPAKTEPATAVADRATKSVVPPPKPGQQQKKTAAPNDWNQGFFSHAMYHLGRFLGAGLRRGRAATAWLKRPGKPGRERHLIPYGSLPVGLLLTPYRQHRLSIALNPAVLVNMRRARLLTNTEFDLLMQHVALQAQ